MDPDALDEVDPPDEQLDPDALYSTIRAGEPVTIVDIRNTAEFGEWHISGESVSITNIPAYDFIDDENDEVLGRVPKADSLVIVCAEGKSSALIAGWLTQQGLDARNLEDGMNGWARVYVANEVSAYEGPGTLIQYHRPSSGCLSYLLVDGEEAAVFDPLEAFADRYLADAAEMGATLRYAVDTHIHADHVSGLRTLLERGVEGVLSQGSLDRGVTYDQAVTAVSDGDSLSIGTVSIEALHTPGHTSGMTSYLIDDQVLVTGDGLFTESVARPDLEAGAAGAREAAETLYETLQERILSLPGSTVIAGGHTSEAARAGPDGTYTADLDDLRRRMSLLDADRETFVDRILTDMPPRPANYERIIAANLGRETLDEREAFELELGPNNCATSQAALD